MHNVQATTIRQVIADLLDVSALPLMRRRERQRISREKREIKATQYAAFGLNGHRAQARRICQIEAGSLRVANGLVL